MLIYQLDEMVIYTTAVITMKSKRIEEKHGRILKLFSGVLMTVLSAVMVINPDLMNNLGTTLLVFALSIVFTALVVLNVSYVLPHFGIFIGHKSR